MYGEVHGRSRSRMPLHEDENKENTILHKRHLVENQSDTSKTIRLESSQEVAGPGRPGPGPLPFLTCWFQSSPAPCFQVQFHSKANAMTHRCEKGQAWAWRHTDNEPLKSTFMGFSSNVHLTFKKNFILIFIIFEWIPTCRLNDFTPRHTKLLPGFTLTETAAFWVILCQILRSS